MPGGSQDVAIIADDYDPLHVTEKMVAGQGLAVEYRLLAKDERKRFRSRVHGEAHHEGERFTLTDQELHMAPGSLGDPFRVIAMLPGVQAPVPLLPLWVVRGASPGTNGFFLDGMRVPQLFHFLLGGGVVHARMIDDVQFYPSAYDTTFGRFAGGVIDGTTRSARDGYHAELELKIYDLGGLFETTQKGVHIEVGGHYGWPAFIIKAFDSSANLAYWDYQLRIDWKGLTVEALGSFDTLSFSHTQMQPDGALPIKVSDAFRLAFYRVQLRDRERWGRVELETALVGGIDQMASFGGVGVQKLSLNARSNLSVRWKRVRLLTGVEIELQRFTAKDFSPQLAAAEPDELGDLAGNRGGVVGGGYAEGVIDLIPQRLTATLGARLDFYHANNVTLLGFDPRAQVRAKLLPWLSVGGGTGIYQQAPSFPVGLPGIDTFALQLGLQRSWQSAVDIQATLPKDLEFKITGFYQRFWNMNDIVLDFTTVLCTSPPPESLTGFAAQVTRQLNGDAYGMEVLAATQDRSGHRLDRLHGLARGAGVQLRDAAVGLRSDPRAQHRRAGALALEAHLRHAPRGRVRTPVHEDRRRGHQHPAQQRTPADLRAARLAHRSRVGVQEVGDRGLPRDLERDLLGDDLRHRVAGWDERHPAAQRSIARRVSLDLADHRRARAYLT